MKKIFGKLALAMAPIALYLALFLAFEPNNYFGLRKTGSGNSPIARMRAYQQYPKDAVVIGDSRLAHFDMALVEKSAGKPFSNVAYGGASLAESIDAFYYLYGQNPRIKEVVFGLSFYTLNQNYATVNRMATLQTQLQDPAAYVFNLEYNINTATALLDKLRGLPDVEETATWGPEDYLDEEGKSLPYRRDLIAYAATLYGNCAQPGTLPAVRRDAQNKVLNPRQLLEAMEQVTPAASRFVVNEKELARLLELADFCREKGIAFSVALPPTDKSVAALVCKPLGIDTAMAPALAKLSAAGVRVLDYEWQNPPPFTDDHFFDGFHLDTRRGLPLWTEQLFREVGKV